MNSFVIKFSKFPINVNKRKRNESESGETDSTRKRRNELDKLIDAGTSSFHFETAKQTAERLGPIHIDVDDEKESPENSDEDEESQSDAEKRRPPGWLTIPSKKKKNPKDSRVSPKKQRLLKKVSPRNSATKSPSQSKITQLGVKKFFLSKLFLHRICYFFVNFLTYRSKF